jgi:hypothetical protein
MKNQVFIIHAGKNTQQDITDNSQYAVVEMVHRAGNAQSCPKTDNPLKITFFLSEKQVQAYEKRLLASQRWHVRPSLSPGGIFNASRLEETAHRLPLGQWKITHAQRFQAKTTGIVYLSPIGKRHILSGCDLDRAMQARYEAEITSLLIRGVPISPEILAQCPRTIKEWGLVPGHA